MAEPWEAVADEALDAFKGALKGFVEREEVTEFGKQQTKLFAQEWWYAQKASTPEEKKEHEDNLKHLVAQSRGEARRLQISISEEAKDTVGRVLEGIGNTLIKMAPKMIEAAATLL